MTISAGEALTVTFPVTVSYGLAAGTEIVNNATITATEMVTHEWTSVTLTVAHAPGVALSPDRFASPIPGAVAPYSHTLTNLGNAPDTFDISHTSSQNWNADYETPITLGAGQSATLVVSVAVPSDAVDGAVDSTVVTARPQQDVGVSATVTDTTTVAVSGWTAYLHIILKNR